MNGFAGLKRCSKCDEQKSLDDFSADRANSDGKRSCCSLCDRKHYAANIEQRRKWRAENKAKIAENSRLRYLNNKEDRDAAAKVYATKPRGRANRLCHSAKERARSKSIPFDITIDHIHVILMLGVCQKSGIPLDLSSSDETWRNPFGPSIDRIDNSRGYEADNVQIVCNMFNSGKGEANEIDFIAMCLAVAARNQNNTVAIARLDELLNAVL